MRRYANKITTKNDSCGIIVSSEMIEQDDGDFVLYYDIKHLLKRSDNSNGIRDHKEKVKRLRKGLGDILFLCEYIKTEYIRNVIREIALEALE